MKCSLLTLSCALDGELSRERQAELESHLVTCERCRTGMRYLHEETERISSLARVAVAPGTATALLERARVATVPPASDEAGAPGGPSTPSDQGQKDPDPFSLMGMGAQIITVDEAPRAIIPLPSKEGAAEVDPASAEPEPALMEPSADQAAVDSNPAPEELLPISSSEEPREEQGATMEADLEAQPGAGDLTDQDTASDLNPWPDRAPTAAALGEMVDSKPLTDTPAHSSDPDGDGTGGEEADGEVVPSSPWELESADDAGEPENHQESDWLSTGDDVQAESAGTDSSSETFSEPEIPAPAPGGPGYDWSEDEWLAESPAASGIGTSGQDEPPPLFVPFYLPVSEPEVVGSPVEPPGGGEDIWSPPELRETAPQTAGEESVAEQEQATVNAQSPSPSTGDSDEVMQVALEESALLGELNYLDRTPGEGLPQMAPPQETVSLPPPPSIVAKQGAGGTGWEPKATLDLGLLPDIAAVKPESSSQLPAAAPATPVTRSGQGTAPRLGESRGPKRPVDSVAAMGGSALRDEVLPRRRRPRTAPPKAPTAGSSRDSAPPRSWTRTATIAIAALAVFLIGWSLLHHSAKPAATSPSHHHAIVPTQSKPTPAQKHTPTPATVPAVTLTGTQSFGGTGSGYQVQGAQYGLHQNNTQLWVVFQLVTGSGAPKVTTGFDGTSALYVEMSGVTPGTAVAQPFSGVVVTSVSPAQMSGFSGAVYLLKLSHSTQIVSEYLLPGSPTSSAGERVVLELQN